jgi:hypothetical protein
MAPNLTLPPKRILTRWGTWLNAAFYYCDNLKIIKEIILQLSSEDSISIKKSQDLIKDPNLKANLIYIKSNVEIILSTIKMIESKDYFLSEAMIKIKNAKTTLKKLVVL